MKFLRSLRECIRYPARATKLAFGFMSMATLIAAMVACFIFHYVENESILNFALAWSFNRTQFELFETVGTQRWYISIAVRVSPQKFS